MVTGQVLRRRLVLAITGSFAAGDLILTAGNYLKYNTIPWEEPFAFVATAGLSIPAVIGLIAYGLRRLRPALAVGEGGAGPGPDGAEAAENARRALLAFPAHLVGVFLGVAVVLTALFHTLQAGVYFDFHPTARWWGQIVRNVLYELNLALLLGLILYTTLRRAIRPVLEFIPAVRPPARPLISLRSRLLLVTITASLVGVLTFLDIYLTAYRNGDFLSPGRLAALAIFNLLFAGWAVYHNVESVSRDLRELARAITGLTGRPRPEMTRALPVLAEDETALVTGAFNELQARVARAYRDLEQDLAVARAVHDHFLRRPLPQVPGLSVAVSARPARDIGGDLYDVLELEPGVVAVAVGDASGKGLPAALLMSATLSLLREAAAPARSPGEVLARLNRRLAATLPGSMFVTMAYAMVDVRRGQYTLASAGHMAPLLLTGTGGPGSGAGEAVFLPVSALPLGVDPDTRYGEISGVFRPGDRLLLYTDGLVEARSPAGEMAGFGSLERWTRELSRAGGDAAALSEGLAQAAEAFRQRAEATDDVTVVVVESTGTYPAEVNRPWAAQAT